MSWAKWANIGSSLLGAIGGLTGNETLAKVGAVGNVVTQALHPEVNAGMSLGDRVNDYARYIGDTAQATAQTLGQKAREMAAPNTYYMNMMNNVAQQNSRNMRGIYTNQDMGTGYAQEAMGGYEAQTYNPYGANYAQNNMNYNSYNRQPERNLYGRPGTSFISPAPVSQPVSQNVLRNPRVPVVPKQEGYRNLGAPADAEVNPWAQKHPHLYDSRLQVPPPPQPRQTRGSFIAPPPEDYYANDDEGDDQD